MAWASDIWTIFGSVLAALSFVLVVRKITARQEPPLPPGPKPLPILRNLLDLPAVEEYKVYTEWGKKYGDVVHVSALGKHIVILNSIDAARDLLDGRSAVYSDRPVIPMLHEPSLMDAGWVFPFARYSPGWRRQRRLFIRHLGPAASQPEFLDIQQASANVLLRSLLRVPNEFVAHLKHASANASHVLTYGYHMQSHDDPLLSIVNHAVNLVVEGILPGRFMVNVFPWLNYLPAWFPGSGFKKCAAKDREASRKHRKVPFDYAKARTEQGTASPSFVTRALTEASPDDFIMDIKNVAATMYAVHQTTEWPSRVQLALKQRRRPCKAVFSHSSSTLQGQARAHAEFDGVLGRVSSPSFRLPTIADRPDLPYIDAVVKETLRWIPVLANGIPHATTEDDIYRGWRIPKGAIVIANAWSMLHEEETYPDPQTFRPERFLGENPAPHPELRGCFGFGRRECPGRHLAEVAIWIQLASLLAVFTLSPGKDEHGRDIDVSYAQDPPLDFHLHPQDFPCIIAPRSKEAEMRVRETSLGEE